MEYRKNDIVTLKIEDCGIDGEGIGKADGFTVFVKDAVIGDTVRAKIMKAKKNYGYGRLEEILTPSPNRVEPECAFARQCGGCQLQALSYEKQLEFKAGKVKGHLERIGGFTDIPMEEILGMEQPFHYRNKAQYPVAPGKGRAVAGFYRAGTHQVVACPQCGILPPEMDAVRDAVVDYMNQYRVSSYDEGSGKGLVRHIYVRKGWVSGQLLVCLVVNGDKLPRQEALLERLQQIPGFATLVLSVNRKPGNGILGETFYTLYGPGWIEDTLCGLTFRLSPRSFYQVNHDQAERLYELAIAGAEIQKTDTVLDLYCGVGTITLAMAKAAGRVIGVEVEPQAVADARDNAQRNGVQNAEFFCGDAGQAARSLREQGLTPDVVVVDPPRKGLSPDVIRVLAQMSPRKIAYISCDPATLARDVALLKEQGFRLLGARAVDMFPRCAHVETVVLLSKGEVESKKVRVEFSLEDMDMSDFQDSATYT